MKYLEGETGNNENRPVFALLNGGLAGDTEARFSTGLAWLTDRGAGKTAAGIPNLTGNNGFSCIALAVTNGRYTAGGFPGARCGNEICCPYTETLPGRYTGGYVLRPLAGLRCAADRLGRYTAGGSLDSKASEGFRCSPPSAQER